MVYRFITTISRSSLVLGMIERFSTDLCPLDLEKFHLFSVSVNFLCSGCMNWNETQYSDLSWQYLGQIWFWVRSNNFWQSYAPLTWKNSICLHFSFIFFTEVSKGGRHVKCFSVSQTSVVNLNITILFFLVFWDASASCVCY